jgi:hypothetical protein
MIAKEEKILSNNIINSESVVIHVEKKATLLVNAVQEIVNFA